MPTAAVRPVAVKLEAGIKERIQRLATARQRTPHWMMREAINQYVEREEKRESLRNDTMKAWSDYKATGQHVTAEEADAWLGNLETGKDLEPPSCHV